MMYQSWINNLIQISGYVSKGRNERHHQENKVKRNRMRNEMAKASKRRNR